MTKLKEIANAFELNKDFRVGVERFGVAGQTVQVIYLGFVLIRKWV